MCCIAFSSLAAYACWKKKTLVFYPVMLALKWYLVRIHHSCIEVLSDSSKLDRVALNFCSIHLNWCETLIREVIEFFQKFHAVFLFLRESEFFKKVNLSNFFRKTWIVEFAKALVWPEFDEKLGLWIFRRTWFFFFDKVSFFR